MFRSFITLAMLLLSLNIRASDSTSLEARERVDIDRLPSAADIEERREEAARPTSRSDAFLKLPKDMNMAFSGIRITGVSVFKNEDFKEVVASYVGVPLNPEKVGELLNRIRQKYRKEGYIVAQAYLAKQTLEEGGILTVSVAEGIVEDIEVKGGTPAIHDKIQHILEAIPIDRPLRLQEYERILMVVREIPGVTIKTVLAPGDDPGETKIIFVIVDQNQGEVGIRGRRTHQESSGLYKITKSFKAYNLVGLGKTEVDITNDNKFRRSKNFYLKQTQLIGKSGLRAYAEMIRTRSTPKSSVHSFSRYEFFRFMLMYPAIYEMQRVFKFRLSLDGGNDTGFTNGALSKDDKNRNIRFGMRLEQIFDRSYLQLSTEVSRGLSDLGARKGRFPSRPGGRHDSTKITFSGFHSYQLSQAFQALLLVDAQYAFTPTLLTEEFSAGDDSFIKGATPVDISGDSGAGILGELQFYPEIFRKNKLSTHLYIGAGAALSRNSSAKTDTQRKDSASSWFFGFRAPMPGNFNLELTFAKPLKKSALSSFSYGWRTNGKIRWSLKF